MLLVAVVACLATPAEAQESGPTFDDQQLEFFENKVRPLLVEKCFDCHGPEASPIEGGLSLASRQAIIEGGDTGPAMEPGNPKDSLLIQAINYSDVYEMPPDTKLPEGEIEILTKWVKMGAPWPKEAAHKSVKKEGFDVAKLKQEHWCWQPAQRPPVPKTRNRAWATDDIDRFLLAKLEQAGLTPAGQASRRVLIRRLYFDIIGLPPTPEQVSAFVNDRSDKAYEKVVDTLLASQHYGERWARHWMDLTRYAETCGHEFDYPLPDAWQYRDYLIRAFNADVPYDDLVREHIAGDLVQKPRRHPDQQFNESILGTGFWYLGEATHGPVDVKGDEAGRIDNQIDVMGKTFLGLTVACARCHDHKFDAISTRDYYALSGFLQSSRRQRVMLDPDLKIQSAFSESMNLVDQADAAAQTLANRIKSLDTKLAIPYFKAAIQVLRTDPDWSKPAAVVAEGETMRVVQSTAGVVEPQEIKPQGNFRWQGNRQIWWRDGKVGDKLKLEFDVNATAFQQKFEVQINLTTAPDYGITTITLDGQAVKNNFDCYSAKLGVTGPISLGTHQLAVGKHQLELEITGHHEKAIPRHMLGVDFLQLLPQSVGTQQPPVTAEQIAADKGLALPRLQRLIEAIKSRKLKSPTHPLHWARQLSTGQQPVQETMNWLTSQQPLKRDSSEGDVVFADFNTVDPETGLPPGWSQTGYAFRSQPENPFSFYGGAASVLTTTGVVHSGRVGKQFRGVLRSPTFELTHNKIQYRIRGSGVMVRLIIDGFEMDLYNGLLFNPMKMNINQPDSFAWIEQAGDVKNYLGHRAHIEIIDHSDGDVSIDEIRFSNGGRPAEHPSTIAVAIGKSRDARNPLVDTALTVTADHLARQRDPDTVKVADWIVAYGLEFMLETPADVSTTASPAIPVSTFAGTASEANVLRELKMKVNQASMAAPAPVFAIGMTDGTGEDEFVFIRGNHKTLGAPAPRNFLSALSDGMQIDTGSGRMQLVEKIVDRDNPLTSRVMVNRLWHHLFGVGIVSSVDNFGVLGQPPTHPELLDYLAVEFVDDDWSLKRMIKRLVMTRAYQMSSQLNPAARDVDPDNRLLHRARIRRLQAEAIRDSMLAISGRLDPKMFGQPVPVFLTEFMQGRGRPGRTGPLDGDGRRSIYNAIRRNFLSPMMLAFDTPIPFNSIGRRNQSNVPAQALILMNDPFVIQQAEHWARQLVQSGGDPESRVKQIYEQALARPPRQDELDRAIEFLDIQGKELGITEQEIAANTEVWRDLCHVIFNVKEFIFIN